MDFVSQASHFSVLVWSKLSIFVCLNSLEIEEDGDGHDERHQAEGVAGEVDMREGVRVSHFWQRHLLPRQPGADEIQIIFSLSQHFLTHSNGLQAE